MGSHGVIANINITANANYNRRNYIPEPQVLDNIYVVVILEVCYALVFLGCFIGKKVFYTTCIFIPFYSL